MVATTGDEGAEPKIDANPPLQSILERRAFFSSTLGLGVVSIGGSLAWAGDGAMGLKVEACRVGRDEREPR